MVITLFNADGALLERVKFKSDCSQPLQLGDVYGGLKVVGMTSHGAGTVSLGAQVKYTYVIKNEGLVALNDVHVEDALGPIPGSPIATLGAGETVTLTQTVLLTEALTNMVPVTGSKGPIQCPDSKVTA